MDQFDSPVLNIVCVMIYLHLLSQDAAESMHLRVGRPAGGHPGHLLLGPEHPAGTVSPQSAHTEEEKHKNKKLNFTC